MRQAGKFHRYIILVGTAVFARMLVVIRQRGNHVARLQLKRVGLEDRKSLACEGRCLRDTLSAWSLPVGGSWPLTNIAIEAAHRDELDFALWLMAERLPKHDIEGRRSLYEAGARNVADYLKLYDRPCTFDHTLYDQLLFWWALSEAVRP